MKKRILIIVGMILLMSTVVGYTATAVNNKQKEVPIVEENLPIETSVKTNKLIIKAIENQVKLNDIVKFRVPEPIPNVKLSLKTSSVEKDLKIKFVNEENNKVVSGTEFKAIITDSQKVAKEYTDYDEDGIIYIDYLAPGTYGVEMIETKGFETPKKVQCKVKGKIEYVVIEIEDEIKTENEINASEEDGKYNENKTEENENNEVKDTVESVDSSKTEVEQEPEKPKEEAKDEQKEENKDNVTKPEETKKTQKIDKFGNLVFAKQKIDKYGSPMFAIILAEPDADHEDNDKNNICDRCNVDLHQHQYINEANEEILCNEELIEFKCVCGDVITKDNPNDHSDENNDNICDVCNEQLIITDTSSKHGVKYSAKTDEATTLSSNIIETSNSVEKIIYDETSAPIYDETSDPVYIEDENNTDIPVEKPEDKPEPESKPEPENKPESKPQEPEYKYTGWQTIDGKTYYFDKNNKKVTGMQVIGGIRYLFDDNGVRQSSAGIDVSKFNPNINWQKVKASGIDFVMIRCGYRGYGSGVLVEDPYFKSHITGAKAAGLRVGVYFFSQAITEAEAIEEASMAINLAKKYGIDLPIAIDSEYANNGYGRADKLSKSERTKITKAFCNTVENAGYTSMVYASKSWFSDHLDVTKFSSKCKIWVAHYADKCGYNNYDMWQYTSKGKINGIDGDVDINIGLF